MSIRASGVAALLAAASVIVVNVVACSSGTDEHTNPPLLTDDPAIRSANPEWYDTTIVTQDGSERWQHTTPEQYARELASRRGGHELPNQPTSQATPGTGENVGQGSSALLAGGDCSASATIWVYANTATGDPPGSGPAWCPTPDGQHPRLCLYYDGDASSGKEWTITDHQYYLCTGGTCLDGPYLWSTHITSFWPGNWDGQFSVHLQTFSANGPCTKNTTGDHDYLDVN